MARSVSVVFLLCVLAATAGGEVLVLANGDEIHGEIVQRDATHVVIDHPQLGRIELSLDQLAADPIAKPSRGLFGSDFLRGWKRTVDVGLTGTEGNSQTLSLTAGMEFGYENELERWLLRGRTFFSRDEDGIADNNATLDLRRDWLSPESRWFARSHFRYQYDAFESWEHRLVLFAGPGYRLVQREAHTLDLVVGPAFSREFGERERNTGEATAGIDHNWRVNSRVSMHLANMFFYDFTSGDDGIRNVTLGELKLEVVDDPDVSLKVGAENEYESVVEPGDEHNDLRYRISLGLDF